MATATSAAAAPAAPPTATPWTPTGAPPPRWAAPFGRPPSTTPLSPTPSPPSTPCPPPHGCYANGTRAKYQGLPLAGALPLWGWQLHGALDLQNPRDPDSGRQLARRARRHATLGADTRLADWSVGAEVQASGRRFDNAANTKVLGGYALLNLYASPRIARDCTLLARIDNLADKDYQLARSYATPGRTLYVGVKWAAQ